MNETPTMVRPAVINMLKGRKHTDAEIIAEVKTAFPGKFISAAYVCDVRRNMNAGRFPKRYKPGAVPIVKMYRTEDGTLLTKGKYLALQKQKKNQEPKVEKLKKRLTGKRKKRAAKK